MRILVYISVIILFLIELKVAMRDSEDYLTDFYFVIGFTFLEYQLIKLIL